MNYSIDFMELTNDEMLDIDGGIGWAAIVPVLKGAAAVAGVGAGGVIVGAGVVIGTYYACKAIFG